MAMNKPDCRWIVDSDDCWIWMMKCSRGYGMAYLPALKEKVH
jgi:hypothetical protein